MLARRPDLAAIRFERGRAWAALGRPKRAARDFAAAFPGLPQPTPDHVFAQRDVLLALGRRAEAIRALDAGIARLGHVPALKIAAVDLDVALGRHDDALRRLDVLIAAGPRNAAWVARRGDILAQAGRADEARVAHAAALDTLAARPAARRAVRTDALAQRLRAELVNTGGLQ